MAHCALLHHWTAQQESLGLRLALLVRLMVVSSVDMGFNPPGVLQFSVWNKSVTLYKHQHWLEPKIWQMGVNLLWVLDMQLLYYYVYSLLALCIQQLCSLLQVSKQFIRILIIILMMIINKKSRIMTKIKMMKQNKIIIMLNSLKIINQL